MQGPDELYPPAQYGVLWLLIAVAILLAIAACGWAIWFFTRPPSIDSFRPRDTAPAVPQGTQLDMMRGDYLEKIRQIEEAYQAGAITGRRANFELSRLVRTFVNEYTGLETPVLSLDDLAERGVHPALVDAVRRHYYPSLFRREVVIDPAAGADAARKVVTAWH